LDSRLSLNEGQVRFRRKSVVITKFLRLNPLFHQNIDIVFMVMFSATLVLKSTTILNAPAINQVAGVNGKS